MSVQSATLRLSLPASQQTINWRFWLQWVFANAVGWAIGIFPVFTYKTWVSPIPFMRMNERVPVEPAAMVGLGLVLGVCQALIMRQRPALALRWMLASVVGWAFAWAVLQLWLRYGLDALDRSASFLWVIPGFGPLRGSVVGWGIIGASVGALLGLVQAFAIQAERGDRRRWVGASSLGWGVGFATGAVLFYRLTTHDMMEFPFQHYASLLFMEQIGPVLIGGFQAMITGATLGRLLRRPPAALIEGANLRFWLLWIAANAVAWLTFALGYSRPAIEAMRLMLPMTTEATWTAVRVQIVLNGAVMGGALGIAQWLVLRWRLSTSAWWVVASAFGAAVGVGLHHTFELNINVFRSGVHTALAGGIVGLGLGLAQALVLRLQVRQASWWVLASAAGFIVVDAVRLAADTLSPVTMLGYDNLIGSGWLAAGLVFGIATGPPLAWLLRH
jgi:hypothetical protein